jgi:hypothetical protein
MSKFYSSRSAPSKSSIPQFKTKAEAENWFAPYGKLNAEGLRAQGGSIIDMNVRHLRETHPVDFTSENRPSYQTKM